MKNLKIKLMLFCLVVVTSMNAQKLSKISKSIKANKDVIIDLNTSYVQIEIDTWNKSVIEIEAYIESDKLSKEELQEALKNWNIEVEGSDDYVKISSKGLHNSWENLNGFVLNEDYGDLLKNLEIRLADMPELPEMPEFPAMFNRVEMPEMPEFPEMPEMPELPELPKGINSVKFDYDAYKKDGEKYLEEWSKDYEKKYGKAYKEKMKEWGRRFGESDFQEKMKAWGENFSKNFGGKWSSEMEVWGEKFGEQFGKEWEEKMAKWGEEFENTWGKDFEKRMEKWGERFEQQMEQRSKSLEHRTEALSKRSENLAKRHEELARRLEERAGHRGNFENRDKVKKVIKIKMPKNAKLKLNVRHGELTISSVIYNLEAEISHSTLVANSIDGSNTSINASYSTILVEDWNDGSLNLNYVDDALLKTVNALILNSNSSNINIDNLNSNAIINGSFGDLVIKNISKSFSNLNIILENSDAFVTLPKTDYNLVFNGNHSRFNNESTNSKTIKNYPTGNSSNKTIVVNAKYSNVVME